MIRMEILSSDNRSVFRVEENGKIRLILKPEDRPILVGKLNDNDVNNKILFLYKDKSNFTKKSYTLGVPSEILNAIPDIKTIALNTRDTDKLYCVTGATLKMFGVLDQEAELHRQKYIFLDHEHWREVGDLEDVLTFSEDYKSSRIANAGGNV